MQTTQWHAIEIAANLRRINSDRFQKNERLLEQIAVAEEYGLLNEALSFLALLPEDEWQKSRIT